MSSDIISCLQLDRNLPSRLIVVKEINGCDSSFIDSCVLGHSIKNKTPLVIITTHNSINHHQNVLQKMNYNLQKYIESGLIVFINLGADYVNNIMQNKSTSLQETFVKIKEVITMKQNEDVNVIIDGVSHLFDMQYSLKDVNWFCKEIFSLLTGNSYLLCHCHEASVDDVTHTMANLLIHKAHTVIEVESLQSGWSTDVSGHLTVKYPGQKFDNEHMYILDSKPTRYLFKLFDRGVKLLAPGTV